MPKLLNLVTAKLEIRPGSDADLAALVAALREPHWFTDRLSRQQRGGGVLLVAWLEGRPVGEVFLDCEPAIEPEVRRQLPGVPRLDHLEVVGPLWGHGTVVGTWVEYPDAGPPVTLSEVCDMLIKRL